MYVGLSNRAGRSKKNNGPPFLPQANTSFPYVVARSKPTEDLFETYHMISCVYFYYALNYHHGLDAGCVPEAPSRSYHIHISSPHRLLYSHSQPLFPPVSLVAGPKVSAAAAAAAAAAVFRQEVTQRTT